MPLFSESELADIQGLLLSEWAHLRRSKYLFLQVQDAAKARAWLKSILPKITTAANYPERPGGGLDKPDTLMNITFTFPGLGAIGLPEEGLYSFAREFIYGMAARSKILGDTGRSAIENWDVGGPNTPEVHILLTLDATDQANMDSLLTEVRAGIEKSGGVTIIHEESGFRHATDKEPFGWLDGISQPHIQRMPGYPEDINNVCATGEFVLGYRNESDVYPPTSWINPEHDPKNILPEPLNDMKDIAGKKDFGRHGTYVVYRKLYQDVATYWNYFLEESKNPDGSRNVERAVFLASKAMGRWPSGAPMNLAPHRDDHDLGKDEARRDSFMYFDSDQEGYGVPIGSHIRRANPRDARVREPDKNFALSSTDKHRLIRRTTAYGEEDLFPRDDVQWGKFPETIVDDGKDRGSQFFALNASIRSQFEFVQVTWSSNQYFDGLKNTKDPISGNNAGEGDYEIPAKPTRIRLTKIPQFSVTKGGGYFFMPSMTALRYLTEMS